MRWTQLGVFTVAITAGCAGPSSIADWVFDPAYQVSAETKELHLIAQENVCAYDGTPPAKRVMPPEVEYGTDQIAVTIRIRDYGGGCIGTWAFPLVVSLAEAVGSRSITHGAGGTEVDTFIPTSPPSRGPRAHGSGSLRYLGRRP